MAAIGPYLKANLLDGEEIVHEARFHWLYTVSAFAWLVMSAAFSLWIYFYPPDFLAGVLATKFVPTAGDMFRLDRILAAIVFLIGFYRYIVMMIFQYTTEMAVTNLRLVFKRGLIARSISSVNADRVEGADVSQGLLGRLLGYGRIAIRGTGVGDIVLPPIDNPLAFRRAMLEVAYQNRPFGG